MLLTNEPYVALPVTAPGWACSPKMATNVGFQAPISPPDQHGHYAEHSARRGWVGVEKCAGNLAPTKGLVS